MHSRSASKDLLHYLAFRVAKKYISNKVEMTFA